MGKQKLLSIIIPSYNRAEMLSYTLSLFHEQVERNQDDVELIVCDNDSKDNTSEVLENLQRIQGNWFSFIHYDDHVEVGESISRSANNATGKFFLLWGDDDVPAPMLVDTILLTINKHPEIGILLLEKVDGYSDTSTKIYNIFFSYGRNIFESYETYYDNIVSFAEENYYRMGLLSADVVRTECWRKGYNQFAQRHLGYEFIFQMLLGAKDYACMCMNWMSVIQRNPTISSNYQHTFSYKWPVFAYVGVPRLLQDLNTMGIITNWKDIFLKNPFNESRGVYIGTIMEATKSGKNEYLLEHIDEICSYQDDKFRKKYTRLLVSSRGWKHRLLTIWIKFYLNPIVYILSLPKKLRNRIQNNNER